MVGIEMSVAASGILADFNAARFVSPAGVHLERTLRRLGDQACEPGLVGLAIALTARALEQGSACLPLTQPADLPALLTGNDQDDPDVEQTRAKLVWPQTDQWLAELAASPLVELGDERQQTAKPLRLVDGQLYFERVWRQQEQLAEALTSRITLPPPAIGETSLQAALNRVFPAEPSDAGQQRQRLAVESALRHATSVIAGGPGTGKTTSVQRLLAVLDEISSSPQRVALAALSGKAAARMKEAVEDSKHGLSVAELSNIRLEAASTLHRLLGSRGRIGFEFGPHNPLPHDWVIVDEVSMISLPMMVQLLSALRPTTRLVLLGDPEQLSSIEVGAVLSDIVAADLPASYSGNGSAGGLNSLVTRLDFNYRFAEHPGLVQLADAVKTGDVDQLEQVLAAGSPEIEFVDVDPAQIELGQLPELNADLVSSGTEMLRAARAGDGAAALAALSAHRLLCANARGPYGVSFWTQQVERALLSQVPSWGRRSGTDEETWNPLWYPGRPLLNTANSNELGIFNGDTGVLIEADGALTAVIGTAEHHRRINPYLLENVDTMHALTIHKSQGSQYRAVTIVLPPAGSKILTRELLYTAITRAMDRVRIIGTLDSLQVATSTPALRASGLAARLHQGLALGVRQVPSEPGSDDPVRD